jgi:hypothetical protein
MLAYTRINYRLLLAIYCSPGSHLSSIVMADLLSEPIWGAGPFARGSGWLISSITKQSRIEWPFTRAT